MHRLAVTLGAVSAAAFAGAALTASRLRAARANATLRTMQAVAMREHGIWLDHDTRRRLLEHGLFAPVAADVTGDGSLVLLRFQHQGDTITLHIGERA